MSKENEKIEEILSKLPKVRMNPLRRAVLREKILSKVRASLEVEQERELVPETRALFGFRYLTNFAHSLFASFRMASPIAISAFLILSVFFVSSLRQEKEAVAVFESINGNVFIESENGEITRASKKSILSVGDKIKVSKNSNAQINFLDNNTSTLSEGTEIVIDSATTESSKEDKKIVAINLKKGNLKTSTKENNKAKLYIKTPSKIIESKAENPTEISVESNHQKKKEDSARTSENLSGNEAKKIALFTEEEISDLATRVDKAIIKKEDSDKEKIVSSETKGENEKLEKETTLNGKKISKEEDSDAEGEKALPESQVDFLDKSLINSVEAIASISNVKLEQGLEKIMLEEDIAKAKINFLGYRDRMNKIASLFGLELEENKEEYPFLNIPTRSILELLVLEAKIINKNEDEKDIKLEKLSIIRRLEKTFLYLKIAEEGAGEIYNNWQKFVLPSDEKASECNEVEVICNARILLKKEKKLKGKSRKAINFLYLREINKIDKELLEEIGDDVSNIEVLERLVLISPPEIRLEINKKIQDINWKQNMEPSASEVSSGTSEEE